LPDFAAGYVRCSDLAIRFLLVNGLVMPAELGRRTIAETRMPDDLIVQNFSPDPTFFLVIADSN